ncbi:MAG: carboxypeptidase regulatory-like domain-containing protein [Bryobacteraceae bacterium]|nr:carboxypeptidase regulatory-like domain-containing protein [Bryobacteraceae bacterium]
MFRTLTVLSALLLLALALPAQDFRGSITGRVNDASGAVVPDAQVTATDVEKGLVTRTRTTATGDYLLPSLAPGAYRLEVEMKGFKKYVREGIILAIQERPTIDVALETGDVANSVTITADASQLEVSTASRGEIISGKTIVDLPLNGRNAFSLAGLAPGIVINNRGQGSALLRTTANAGISSMAISGGQLRQNEVLLDGVPNTGTDGTIQFIPSVDATQEFKVQTNNFDAEYGRFTGGVINAMVKSGTNEIHGSAFWFIRNSAMNARDPFATTIPQFGYNLFGASAGGPVVLPKIVNGRNRTFWFFNYEGSREGVPRAFVATVPTVEQRAGNFSNTRVRLPSGQPGAVTIFDPATTTQAGNAFTRTPFAGNIIPADRFDPVARNLLARYPLPNAAGDSITGSNNFLNSFKDPVSDNGYVIKIDHRFSDRHAIFGRYSFRRFNVGRAGAFRNELTADREQRDAPGVALDDTWTISPTAVLNIRYGYTRYKTQAQADSLGADLAALGFPANYAGTVRVPAFPQITIAGFTTVGGANKFAKNVEDAHSLRGTMTKVVGRQTLKFGAEGRLLRSNINSQGAASSGAFNFDSVFTRGPNPQVNNVQAGFGLASFLLGLGASGSVQDNVASADQLPYYGLLFQDDIRVSRTLTLNLGVRYEWEGAYTERYNRLNRGFDATTNLPIADQARANYARSPIAQLPADQFQVRGGLLFAGVNGVPRGLANVQRSNIAPRIGAAWQVTQKTVLRGGYGIFYGASTLTDETRNGFSISTPFVGTINGSLTPVNTLRNPFPDGLATPRGAADGLMTLTGQGISFTNPERGQPRAQQYQFGIQRELPWQLLADAAYVGSYTDRVSVSQQLNGIPASIRDQAEAQFRSTGRNFLSDSAVNPFRGLITTGTLTGANTTVGQLVRPFPQFTSVVRSSTPIGKIRYDALQAKLSKRFSSGLSFITAYTWMKQLEQTRFLNDQDLRPVKELSDFDTAYRLSVSTTYELPFGPGRSLLASATGVTRALVQGWQLNVIYSAQGGIPVSVGGAQSLGRSAKLENPTVGRWFDTSAFRQLLTLEQNGTSRLPDVRTAGRNNFDISIFKTTTIHERFRVQFRAEAFNALNRPEWSGPDGSLTSQNFGVVTSTNTFARQLQLGLKLLW